MYKKEGSRLNRVAILGQKLKVNTFQYNTPVYSTFVAVLQRLGFFIFINAIY